MLRLKRVTVIARIIDIAITTLSSLMLLEQLINFVIK